MKTSIVIGIGILLLISGCVSKEVVEEKIEVPTSGAPYNYTDLTSITFRLPMRMVKDKNLSEAGDVILERLAPEIKTFTGEKYIKFEPVLEPTNSTEKLGEFVFKGRGYVDAISYDEYEIYVDYDRETGRVVFDQKNFGLWGVPIKYKIMAEEIARKEKGLDKEEWPLSFLIWDPQKQGKVDLSFKAKIVTVDLENQRAVE